MELRLADRTFGPGEYAVMADKAGEGVDIALVAADPEVVHRACSAAGRPVVAVAPASAGEAARCVRAGAALLVGDAFAEVAAETGAALVCSSPGRAAGVRPDGLIVTAAVPEETERLAGDGLTLLVDEPVQAVTAVHAWLGARVFRTDDVRATRQVLDMVASIRGTRPPAVTRRGLA
jgi:hypothetical protein